MFWLAIGWLSLIVFLAIFADLLPLHAFDTFVNDLKPRTAPRFSFHEPLGTDVLGRSETTRLIYGAQQSLLIGIGSVALATVIGLVVGMAAGYFRGKVAAVLDVFLDAILAVPPLVLLIAFAAVGNRTIEGIIIAFGVVLSPITARVARANTILLENREYVLASRAVGSGHIRILTREILPEVLLRLLPIQFLMMGQVIVAEAALSFLGLGIPSPAPSWGSMINESRNFLDTQPYLVFVPAVCILLTVASFITIGDHIRRVSDTGQSALS
jgi:peptide/nickel transport system permease protein